MTLALKRVQPDDYDVFHDGEIIGRIYRMIGVEEFGVEELWRWRLPGSRALTDGPSGGICTSLDQAKVAFQRAFSTWLP